MTVSPGSTNLRLKRLSRTAALAGSLCVVGISGSASAQVTSSMNGFAAEQMPAPQLASQLAEMQAAGVQVVRADSPWANIEPQPPSSTGVHHYQWGAMDAWATALATHHLRWQPLIDFSVWWAKTCPGFCAPTSNATFATFAQAVAARYGADGSFWAQNPKLPYLPAQIFEIWNEENVSTFFIDSATFGPLYLASRRAIHAVDPAASVDIGGLADDSGAFQPSYDYPSWYVIGLFAHDPALAGNVDGFALHPYGATAADVEQWVAEFRHVLVTRNEGSAPIDITEIGWPTGDLSHEAWRASQMGDIALKLANTNCGLRMLAPYDWVNPGTSAWGDFGLVDSSGLSTALRPAGAAWFNGLTQANARPTMPLCA
jgi:hypothetical protein